MKDADPKKSLSRRKFMQMGAAAAAVGLASGARVPRARAAGSAAPLRLIQLWYPWHVPEIYYHPKDSAGGQAKAGSNFNLSFTNSVLAPLAAYQSKLLIFRGLNYAQGPSAHASGGGAFTGAKANGITDAFPATTSGTSIDQYLYTRMAQTGSLDPIVAGLLSYCASATFSQNGFSYGLCFRNGNAQAQIGDPQKLLSTYFGNFNSASNNANDPEAPRILARRTKTLSIAKKGLDEFLSRLPSTSQSSSLLQQHQTSLASMTASLTAKPFASASCVAPTTATIPGDPGPDQNNVDFSKVGTDFKSFASIITEAFACDVTRFATIKMSATDDALLDVISHLTGLSNYNAGNFHNNVSHACDGSGGQNDLYMALQGAYWHQCLAQLMAMLEMTADPYSSSQSLLDNTVILMNSEGPIHQAKFAVAGVHNDGHEDQPLIVAGGCGGMFKMGQIVDARPLGTVTAENGNTAPGINHNALLTNIVNAFEQNQQAFNPAYTPKILTQYGDYGFPVSPTNWLA